MIAPLKKEKNHIRLFLSSNGASDWSRVVYDIHSIIPYHKRQDLMKAETMHFQLESISWIKKDYNLAYTIHLDNILDDMTFSNKPLNRALEVLFDDTHEYFTYEGNRGITTRDKSWIQNGKLEVSFRDMQGDVIGKADFKPAADATVQTEYLAQILLSYM